jgi:hypothetical protein
MAGQGPNGGQTQCGLKGCTRLMSRRKLPLRRATRICLFERNEVPGDVIAK